jgi:choline dehydrogenase-like flavoprotein
VSGWIRKGRDRAGDLELDADAVIVGSGAGGAVVASILSEAGESVVVLEEGGHYTPEEYGRMRPSEHIRHLWRDGAMTVAIGVGGSPSINVTMGRCVGGSSVLTGGVCFRAPDTVLRGWADELGLGGLSPEGMDAHYAEVEAAIHVEEVPVAMRSVGTRLFGQGAEEMGYSLKPLRRNTDGCNGCGECNFGCPHQAKLSVDISYLPRALANGTRVLADCRVDQVIIEGDRAVGVRGRVLNRSEGGGSPVTVHARKRVVVAAGAYHSPLVLRRSRVGRRSKHLGRHMTLHPSFRMLARFDEPVRGWHGALQSAYSDAFEEEGITLVGLFVPPAVLAATLPGVGPAHAQHATDIGHLAMFGGLIHDHGGGRVRPGPGGEPLVTYRMDRRDRARIPRVIRLLADTFLAAGARELYLPIIGHPPVDADGLGKIDWQRVPPRRYECSSQHPLGTCRMGAEPGRSVVDPNGRVWGLANLYVADGSVIPTSLGVNPQLTVMAMATRIGRLMV